MSIGTGLWEKNTRTCEICGLNRGPYFDHSECSKRLREIYKEKNESKQRAKSILSKKELDFLCKVGDE